MNTTNLHGDHPGSILAHTVVFAGFWAASTGCSATPETAYDPAIQPGELVTSVTNPFFPLAPGTRLTYEDETADRRETIVVEVRTDTRVVNGVAATVVRDRVYVDGELIEDTLDWYAQDGEGNVWYLGEDSREIENGEVVSSEGSWEWGVDGALPGVIMWADPAARLGEEYRQEYLVGEAEDWGKVTGTNVSVDVPFGSLSGCIVTEDWSGLESGAREQKTYCPGVGVVLEQVPGSPERVELVSVESG